MNQRTRYEEEKGRTFWSKMLMPVMAGLKEVNDPLAAPLQESSKVKEEGSEILT